MSLREIAEHEAAHAVAALACGSLVVGLELCGRGGEESRALTWAPNPHRVALFAVAGNAQAGRRWLGLGDARLFTQAVRGLGEKPSAGHVWRYRLRAREILTRYQPAVQALASALLRAGSLRTERGIRRIAFKASPELRELAERGPVERMASRLYAVASLGREPLEDRQLVWWNLAAFVREQAVLRFRAAARRKLGGK